MLKKSQNYFDHDHGKKTKRILYIYVVLRAGKFSKFLFFAEKIRCGAQGLSISCYQAVAAFFNMPREDHIFG